MRMKNPVVNSSRPDLTLLEVLDARHRVVAAMSPGRVHSQGLWHQRAAALVYSKDGSLMVSRRSPQCPDCPLGWDVSLSEHVYLGCSVYETVRAGLYARLGGTFSKLRLAHVLGASPQTDNEILTVYSVHSATDLKPDADRDEMMLLQAHEVDALVHAFPGQVSSTLRFLHASGLLFG